jgi:hypothetical protein
MGSEDKRNRGPGPGVPLVDSRNSAGEYLAELTV